MSLKQYGIYLAYPPHVNLHIQGLGRHLIEFLKHAQRHQNVRFFIACPSWMRQHLLQLCQETGIQSNTFTFITPRRLPLMLRLFQFCQAVSPRKNIMHKRGRLKRTLISVLKAEASLTQYCKEKVMSLRHPFLLFPLILLAGIIALIECFKFMFIRTIQMVNNIRDVKTKYANHLAEKRLNRNHLPKASMTSPSLFQSIVIAIKQLPKTIHKLKSIWEKPEKNSIAARLYQYMLANELKHLTTLINARSDITAWYCPTAFWPAFHDILKPRLMCVPDVTVSEFPVGFAAEGPQVLVSFTQLENAIHRATAIVTYSEHIKWHTLISRYHIPPQNITVIRNGANLLGELIQVSGFHHNQIATDHICRHLLKDVNLPAGRFIFYASQYRPNKNILSLLRAYQYLFKRRYIGHKLVLTIQKNPTVTQFLEEHRITNEVICLPGLSSQQLAACYRLADLAVNPSLAEGSCPFTFTESLSVGTPVVMARIPVTEEAITCTALQSLMLFDPYNWHDMAARIEWGLQNQKTLLEKQLPVYQALSKRTWAETVDDYIALLDSLSAENTTRPTPSPPWGRGVKVTLTPTLSRKIVLCK